MNNILREKSGFPFHLSGNDLDPGLIIGKADRRENAGSESGLEIWVHLRDFIQWIAACEDEFFVGVEKGVECKGYLVLYLMLSTQKLDVIQEKEIAFVAVFCLKGFDPAVLERSDHFIGKILCGNITDARALLFLQYFVSYCLRKVAFAEAGISHHEDGIVAMISFGCQRKRRGIGKIVAQSHYKSAKGKAWSQGVRTILRPGRDIREAKLMLRSRLLFVVRGLCYSQVYMNSLPKNLLCLVSDYSHKVAGNPFLRKGIRA